MVEKDKIKNEIFEILKKFYNEYQLPPLNISNEEWNVFLDVLDAHFIVHNISEEYFNAINIIIRRALNLVLMNNQEDFNISHLIAALCDLSAFKVPHDEINAMRDEISEKISANIRKR